MVALAEAIIPGTSTIPGADDTTVREVAELITRVSPKLATAWTAAHRALDAAARLRTGRAFHALSAARQQSLLVQWERDPLLKIPLTVLAAVYKVVHFDAPHVQRAMGARPRPPLPVVERRWMEQVQDGASWTGGDVECDVVVMGTGAGGAVVGHALAERGHAVVFVEEGQLHQRHSFDGSMVRAYERFYRPVFAVGNATFPVLIGKDGGRVHGGERRHRLPHAGVGARALVRGDGHRRLRALADGALLRAGGEPPRGGAIGPEARRATSGRRCSGDATRSAGLTAR